jgi:outer membrane receptor protein involved in Fe transport
MARTASPFPGPVTAWLSSLQVDGRIEAGATFNPAGPETGVNFGHLFTDKANQFVLNQFDLNARRTADPRVGGVDLGFDVEGIYGMDSQFTHFLGIGDQGSAGRNSFDVLQANIDLKARPTAGLAFDAEAGLFLTPMGYEKLDPTRNFFYSDSYIFNFGLPRKAAGVLTTTQIGSSVDLFLGVDTGANTSIGPGGGYDDGQAHVLGGIAVRLKTVTVEAFTHIGPEDTPSALPLGVDAHRQLRYYDDLFVTWAITPRLSSATEFNYLRDDGLKADAGGVAEYLTWRFSQSLSAGVRAEVWRDAKGVFVAGYPGNLDYLDAEEGVANTAFRPGPATYGELTLGLNIKPALDLKLTDRPIDSPFRQMTVRPEIRYDRILAGDSGFGGTPGSARDQVTFAVDVVLPLSFQRDASGTSGRDDWMGGPAEPSETIAAHPASDAPAAPLAQAPNGPISVVTARELAPTNPQTLQDVDVYLPDVTLAQTPTGVLAPWIRGLGDPVPHDGQTPAVGLNLDGVAIDGAFAELLDPGELSSVQVAYGPSGLFEGRDASAGVIDLSRAKPTRAFGIDAEYSLEQGFHASDERVRLDAPVGRTAGLALSFSHQQRGGYEDDVYSANPLFGRRETSVGALQFDWSLTPALEADLSVTLAHGDGQGNPLALGDTLDAQQLGPALRAASPGLQFNTWGSPYLPGRTQALGQYQTAADGADGQSVTARLYDLTLAYDSPVGRLTTITAFLNEDQSTGQDLDGGCAESDLGGLACPVLANPLVDVLQASTSLAYRQFSQEVRLDHDFGQMLQTRLGAYVLSDQTTHAQLTRTADGIAAAAPGAGQASHQDETSWALYADVTVHPTSRLRLEGGLRWVHDDERYGAADSLTALSGGGPAVTGDASAGHLLSRLAIDYALTDGLSLYAQRATGFRPGGLSLGSTLAEQVPGQSNYDPANPHASYATFGPQTDTSYEIGSRVSVLSGQVTGRVSGYLTRIRGMQAPELVLTPGFAEAFDTYVVNLPKVETKGAEAEMAWRPVWLAGLTLSGFGAWEDARITDGLVPAAQAPVNASASAGAAGATYDLTGTPLVRTPKFDATARADYVLAIGPGRCDFDLAYDWTARYALAVSGGQADWQGAYGMVDLTLGYQRSFYRITVTARNILNKTYLDSAVPAFFSHAWGAPRTVVVSLEASF